MEQSRLIFVGVCLLLLRCAVDASTIREMLINNGYNSPVGDIKEEVPTEHALIKSDDDDLGLAGRFSDEDEVAGDYDTDTSANDDLDLAGRFSDDYEYEVDSDSDFDTSVNDDLDLDDQFSDEDEADSDYDADSNDIGTWWGNKKIAFSAYLSRDKLFGKKQHVKFDQVLLNDGNGYEASTGIFRAPVSGVYSFTFVIGLRHTGEIRTNLVMDGKVVVGAIAEGTKTYHDTQGTNTVNVHVCKGKPVWVESYSGGKLEGSSGNYRYTSFSGHILYERK